MILPRKSSRRSSILEVANSVDYSIFPIGPWTWQSNSFITGYSSFYGFCDSVEVSLFGFLSAFKSAMIKLTHHTERQSRRNCRPWTRGRWAPKGSRRLRQMVQLNCSSWL